MSIDTSEPDDQDQSSTGSNNETADGPLPPVGDGYDAEPLLTAEDVGIILQVPTKSVYELPIPKVRISKRRIRYRPADVEAFIEKRASKS